VMTLPDSMRENNPVNLDARLAQVSSGVIRLDSQLMVVLDIDRVLQVSAQIKAA
jgi:purine-binding chemotaxis protein CheW